MDSRPQIGQTTHQQQQSQQCQKTSQGQRQGQQTLPQPSTSREIFCIFFSRNRNNQQPILIMQSPRMLTSTGECMATQLLSIQDGHIRCLMVMVKISSQKTSNFVRRSQPIKTITKMLKEGVLETRKGPVFCLTHLHYQKRPQKRGNLS